MAKITGNPSFGLDQIILWVARITNGKTSYMGMLLIVGGLAVFAGMSLDYLPESWSELGVGLLGAGFTTLLTGAKHKLQKLEQSQKDHE